MASKAKRQGMPPAMNMPAGNAQTSMPPGMKMRSAGMMPNADIPSPRPVKITTSKSVTPRPARGIRKPTKPHR